MTEVVAVVPYRGRGGKSRLAPVLGPTERRRLSSALLQRVLAALREAQGLDVVAVVSPEAWTDDADGPVLIRDHGTGLNDAVRVGARWAARISAAVLVVVAADLPLVTPDDIEALVKALPSAPGAVVAPSKDGGTNALALRGPQIIQPAFGPDSARRHRELVASAGGEVRLVARAGLEADIDLPRDLRLLQGETLDVIRGAAGLDHRVAIHGSDQTA